MGSAGSEEASQKVPILDFTISDAKEESLGTTATSSGSFRLSKANQVRHALEEYGCFVAAYDGVPSQLVDKMMAQSKDLFELPTESKISNTNDDANRGYIGPNPHIPYYETFGIDHATSLQDVQNFTNLMWPAGKDQFCETTHSYAELIEELGEWVMRLVFESYGVVGKRYESFAASKNHILRLIKYREAKDIDNTGTNVWLRGHTDPSFITILFQHQIGGFEIKTKDGTFVGIDASPSHFIVLAGDMLQVWSNDRIKSCHHQVRIWDVNMERYSLGMFIYHSGTIQVPEEVVDEKHPLLYKPCDCLSYLAFVYTDEAKTVDCPMKLYCGI